jgi:hypothetical protein
LEDKGQNAEDLPQGLLLEAKQQTIDNLTNENTRLFHKLAEEREFHKLKVNELESKLANLEKELLEFKNPLIDDGRHPLVTPQGSCTSDAPLQQSPIPIDTHNSSQGTTPGSPVIVKSFKDTSLPRSRILEPSNTSNIQSNTVQSSVSVVEREIENSSLEQSPSSPSLVKELRKTPQSNLRKSISLDPATEKSFKYQEVVRDKETRGKMHGIDCPCCSDVFFDLNSIIV